MARTKHKPPRDERADAAYRYFESLGPGRSLDRVIDWDLFASRSTLERWARDYKWWDRAREYDAAEQKKFADEHKKIVTYTRGVMARGILGTISEIFRVEPDGQVRCGLKINDWDDLTKALRLLDYVALEDGDRDPSKLADAKANLHMLVVQALEGRQNEPGVFAPSEVINVEATPTDIPATVDKPRPVKRTNRR
jgi:hypothetical protein